MKYVQKRWATRGEITGGRYGGARRWQINNFGKLWNKFCWKKVVVGDDSKGEPRSRNQGKV